MQEEKEKEPRSAHHYERGKRSQSVWRSATGPSWSFMANKRYRLTSLNPLFVHHSASTLPATDRFPSLDLVVGGAICRQVNDRRQRRRAISSVSDER